MSRLTDVCFQVLGMEGAALTAAVGVCLAMLLLMALPIRKRISYLLLLVVLFRLLTPAELFSRFSAFNLPAVQSFSQSYTLPADGGFVGERDIAVEGTESYHDALQAGLTPEYEGSFSYISYIQENGVYRPPVTFREKYGSILARVWAVGAVLVWSYGLLSAVLLRRRVSTATILEKGVYESDRIAAPFILGFFRPVIYLPLGLSPEQRRLILCHERMHLKWKDPQMKVLAFFAMGLHWINPLVWLWFYRQFLYVIEEACDQDALTLLGEPEKADYSQTLFLFASRRQTGGPVTVAFGESHVKDRVRAALKYRKPVRLLTLFAGLLAAVMMVSFSTSGVQQDGIRLEFRQTIGGPEDGQLQLELLNGPNVRSAALDLELWSPEGMVQGSGLFSHRLSGWWSRLERTPDPITLSYSFREHSPKTIDWAAGPEDGAPKGSVALPKEYPYCYLTGFSEETLSQQLSAGESLYLPIAVLSQEQLNQQTLEAMSWQAGYHSAGDIPISEGQLIVTVRLRASAYPGSDSRYTVSELFPKAFWDSTQGQAVYGSNEIALTGRQASDLLTELRQLPVASSVFLGKADLDQQNNPCLIFTDPQDSRHTLKLVFDRESLLLWDSAGRTLTRLWSDGLKLPRFSLKILRALNLPFSARQKLGLPEEASDSTNGWSLLAAQPQQDVWLYASEQGKQGLLLIGSGCYDCQEGYLLNKIQLSYQDFSGDGLPELALTGERKDGNEQGNQRLCLYSQLEPETGAYRMDLLSVSDMGYPAYLGLEWTDFIKSDGTTEDFFTLSFYRAPETQLELSYSALTGQSAKSYRAGDDYRGLTYGFGQGVIFAAADFYLSSELPEEEPPIPCARVSASIRWNPDDPEGAQWSSPFSFFDYKITPLSPNSENNPQSR